MKRIDVHIKVTIDLNNEEDERKVAAEICRAVEKIYGVRKTEVTTVISSEG